MRMKKPVTRSLSLLAASLSCLAPPAGAQSAGDNMTFSGRLVAEACTLSPESEKVRLNFLSVPDRVLYVNGRTPGRPITLRLLNCDISQGNNSLSIYFEGPESAKQPGLLALDSDGIAGVAIGLETPQGNRLPLKTKNAIGQVTAGTNNIEFMAYLQGEKEALESHQIGRGEIKNATLTFTLAYD
ncbi:fimbrial protein [Achromobacter sp. Bel]|uniref:fimbrial protein n=1 Tax=Achromobacter sp. Bel TaxID=2727415 RepID=UPI00145F451A|nr:fimbrial protein [Achromobacter sp. Bel]NMK48349.1 type 1 fimbrial protein [Achromobacter sp. Bel]